MSASVILRVKNLETGLEHTVTESMWLVLQPEEQIDGSPRYKLLEEPKRQNSRRKAAKKGKTPLKTDSES